MNKIKHILLIPAALLCTACLNNEFLDQLPKDKLTEETLFVEDRNFQTYALSLYEVFPAYQNIDALYGPHLEADDFFRGAAGTEDIWGWQKVIVPAHDGGWNFEFIRDVNLMLDNIDKENKLTVPQKEHWRSVGYFFRAYKYLDLVSRFGDVTWVDHVLDNKSEELYKARDSREVVTKHMLDDLTYAEAHIIADADNFIDQDVVRALITRFGLFEGTWRKYHGMEGGEVYLEAAVKAGAALAEKHPELAPRYDDLFNSLDLKGMPGVLLYRSYQDPLSTHGFGRYHMSNKQNYEMTKNAVDSYLCQDGKPFKAHEGWHEIEKDPYTEFENRDTRLYVTVMPPYKVKTSKEAFTKVWEFTDNPRDAKYFSVMEEITAENGKRLPIRQNGGSVCKHSPHFTLHNGGFGFEVSQGGYWVYKYLNHQEAFPVKVSTSDAPIFRMGEVLLNWAEAAYELGQFNQEIADKTINKLRARAKVAPLQLTAICEDPDRDPDVDPVLWEIRRERRVELMAEGFRFNDLRRWKKADYINNQKFGRWYSARQLREEGLLPADKPCKLQFTTSMEEGQVTTNSEEGYIVYYGKPLGWQEHYYLYPLPLDDLALNPKLKQNPGWE